MSFGSVKSQYILSIFQDEITGVLCTDCRSSLFNNTISVLKEEYPSLLDEQLLSILDLLIELYNRCHDERVELVVTAPPSFGLGTKRIQEIVGDMISEAQSKIIITGYSISEFVDEYIEEIIEKSKKGVFVKVFINKADQQKSIEKILQSKGRFLQIYNYTNSLDKMSALHAKVLSIDGKKTLISSANLSYHGMSGNIELGSLIYSNKIADKLDKLLQCMIFRKIFKRIE